MDREKHTMTQGFNSGVCDMSSEFQKPFSEVGYLNAELITRKHYCGNPTFGHDGKCHCDHCESERDGIKRRVNELTGREFYKGL